VTGWHPELAVVGPGCAHVYLVPDNGSLSRIHTVTWATEDRDQTALVEDTASAILQLFRQVDVPFPEDALGLARHLWAQLDRRKKPATPV
jgi:hypothetical protein